MCDGAGIERQEIVDLLCSLVDKSLVTADERDGVERYRMLYSTHVYALERLEASGEAEGVRRQHAEYFLRYRGFKAAFWDLLRGDTSKWEDRSFYWDAIKASGEPALDIGCGTGRLLLDFLARGIDIDGVDNSAEMLDLCRKKAKPLGLRPALFLQSMEDLQLSRSYRTIIVPSSSFQLITDRAAAAVAMRHFFRHLEPGGNLVMPFMLNFQQHTDNGKLTTDWRIEADGTNPEDGAAVRRWSRSTFDFVNQLEDIEDRYEVIQNGEVVDTEHQVRSPATRWYTQPQVRELYAAAGFSEVRLVHGFTDSPATEADTIFSAFGRRP